MKIDDSLFQIQKLTPDGFYSDNTTIKDNIRGKDSFGDFFDAAMGLYNETNAYQLKAEQMQIDYVTGKSDDMIGLQMAQSYAASALQFTTQVTSKVLSAYQEIMRMQI